MSKSIAGLAILLAVLGILVGGLFTYGVFPREVEITKIVTKEVPVEKIVETPVEVEKIVEVERDFISYLAEAEDLCLEEFLEDQELDRYQEAEITKTSNNWSISFGIRRDKDITTVEIENLRIKVFDTLDDTRQTFNEVCKVVYQADKEPKVSYA